MTKQELQKVKNALLNKEAFKNENIKKITLDQLFDTMGGCAYWEGKKYRTFEMLVKHLEYQCRFLSGGIDYAELDTNLEIYRKHIVMI
jgi:hypothetical protein